MGNIDITQVVQYENQILIWTLVGILVIMLLAFIRGIFRGWRYGTYRLGYFLILIIIGLACLEPIANGIGGINIAQWYAGPINFSFGGNDYSVEVSTLFETIKNAVDVVAKTADPNLDPASMQSFVLAFSTSLIKLLVILIEGILLATVFNLLGFLLWHIAFKRIIPATIRKTTYKKGRVWSSIEEFVGVTLVMAMMILPITSVVNSIVTGWNSSDSALTDDEKGTLKANDSTYSAISDVVDTYDNSVFSKVFFSWTKTSDGNSFDSNLMNFFTKCDYSGVEVSITSEIGTIANLGSTFIKTGILSSQGTNAEKTMLLLDSKFTPMLISALGSSKIVTSILPFACAVATNMDAVEEYIGNDCGLDYSSYDWAGTLENLAGIVTDIQESGALGTFTENDSGNLSFDVTKVSDLFSDTAKTQINEAFAKMSNDSTGFKLFNDLIKVAAAKAALNADPTSETLGIADFLPAVTGLSSITDSSTGEKIPSGSLDDLPADYQNLNLGSQIAILYRSMQRLYSIDSSFIGLAINGAITNDFSMDELTKLVVNNIDDVASVITGENADGSFSNDDDGTSADDDCLLDSSFINNAMPKFVTVMANSLSSSLGGDIDMNDVEDTLFGTDDDPKNSADRMTSIKEEIHNVLKVVEDFTANEASKNFLLNLDTMPGITFDPDSSNITYISDALLSAIGDSLADLDKSLIMSTLIPSIFTTFLSGDNSPLASIGLGDISFDLSFKGLGTELSKLINTYINCQDLLNYIRNSGLTSGASSGFLKGLIPYLENTTDSKTGNEIADSSQLYDLLYGFASNKILNPDKVVEGKTVTDSNFRSLISSVMKTITGNSDFSYTGTLDPKTDSGALTDFLRAALTGDALDFLTSAMSGDVQMSSLSSVSFESLLAPLDDSELLSSCFGSMMDKQFLSLFDGADTTGVSFSNLDANNDGKDNWENEGKSLDTLVKAAGQIGDLSNIDFFGSDSVAIGNIIECLSSSKIFTDADGSYHFGSFFFGILKSSIGESNLSFIADSDGSSYTKITNRFSTMSQADWSNESDVFANIIYSLQKLGGLDSFSGGSINWSKFTPERISSLLNALASSKSIGQNVTYKLYSTLISTLKTAGLNLGSNSDDLGNCNVSYIYDLFDVDTDAALTARETELGKITNLVEAVTGSYGLVKSDGTLKSIDMTSASGEFFVKPVLNSLASSYVFNTSKSDKASSTIQAVSSTAFECEMASLVESSEIYGTGTSASATSDEILDYVCLVDPIRDVSSSNISARLSSSSAWANEIDAISSAVDDVKTLGLNFSNLSVTSLFKDSNGDNLTGVALESKRQDLENVLSDVNNSKVFFRALPNYIKQGLSSMSNQLGSINTDDANVYYNGQGKTAVKYDDDEITTLTYIMVDGLTSASNFSTTNIAGLDADKTSSLLSYMASSRVFNSRKTDAASNSATLFQEIIVDMLSGTGDVSTYYYNASSPKDIAQASSYNDFNISSTPVAEQKARYYANLYFPDVVASGLTITNYRSTYCDNVFTSSTTGSFKSLLTFLSSNQDILTSFNSTASLKSIDSTKMQTLLSNLNENVLLKDTVPNLLATFLSSSEMNIEGVTASLANPYFEYWYNSESVNLASTPKYEASYPDEEIDTISSIFKDISTGQSTLNSAFNSALTSDSITSIKTLLTDLAKSYVFHKAGAWYGSATASTPTVTVDTPTADLTVFEQSIYLIYNKSSLASRATSSLYDSLTENGRYNVTDGYKLKLHDMILSFNTSSGTGSTNPNNFSHPGNWTTEINDITDDGSNGGLLTIALNGSLLSSGVNFGTTTFNFNTFSSDDMATYAKAINKLDIVNDMLPYEMANYLTNGLKVSAMSQTAMNTYTVADTSASFSSKTTWGNIGSISSVTFSGTGSINLSYSYNGTDYSASEVVDLSSSPVTKDYSSLLPSYFIATPTSGSTLTAISSLKFDTSDVFLSQSQFDDGAGTGAIDSLVKIIDKVGRDPDTHEVYSVAFDNINFFSELLEFINNKNGFYMQRGYDANSKVVTTGQTYYSRDVSISNILSPTYQSKTADLGQYIGSSFSSFKAMFDNTKFSSATDGDWLNENFSNAMFSEVSIDKAEAGTIGSYSVPAIHITMALLSDASSGTNDDHVTFKFVSMLDSLASTSSTKDSIFGKAIANGLMNNLIGQWENYGANGTHTIVGSTPPANDSDRKSAVTLKMAESNKGFSTATLTYADSFKSAFNSILNFAQSYGLKASAPFNDTTKSDAVKALITPRDSYTSTDAKLICEYAYMATEYDYFYVHGAYVSNNYYNIWAPVTFTTCAATIS